ncbi:hypothetical protein CLOM_g21278 [Closterium sp. NIES-68]|nr:hypothetical protein CLOM_g21278 [Closterium sp. NIES-68]GJP78566.1 hypothetical protein CLOP_g8855 [Closterium sp. NIES-67]
MLSAGVEAQATARLAALPLSFLVMSSVLPVVKVLLIAATGLIFALPYFDVLHADARKSLSKLVFTVFLPAIIFVNLGEAISFHNLLQWWFIPVNVVLASLIGCALGMLVAWLTDCPPEFFRLVFVLTGIGNMGNMPLVLLSAVCSDARNPFGGHQECNKLGTAYISLGMWMAAIIMWSTVYNILAPPEEWLPGYVRPLDHFGIDHKYVDAPMVPYQEADNEGDDDASEGDGESQGEGWEVDGGWEAALGVGVEAVSSRPIAPGEGRRTHHVDLSPGAAGFGRIGGSNGAAAAAGSAGSGALRSPLLSPTPAAAAAEGQGASVPRLGSARAMEPGQHHEGSLRGGRAFGSSRTSSVARTASRTLRKASVAILVRAPNTLGEVLKALHIYDIFRPPVLAACLAMLIGMVPELDFLFFHKDGALRFLSDALAVLGQAMIPCILLVLGANLVKGPGASALPMRTTLAVVVTRLVLVPLVGIALVLSADRLGLLPPGDKMFRFVLLLQHAMPSSIQIGTACSLRGFGEQEVSAVLFFQHISAVFTMAVYLFVFFFLLYG